jgi:hypothetical protein
MQKQVYNSTPSKWRGLTLVQYSAQPEPFLSLKLNNYPPKSACVELNSARVEAPGKWDVWTGGGEPLPKRITVGRSKLTVSNPKLKATTALEARI